MIWGRKRRREEHTQRLWRYIGWIRSEFTSIPLPHHHFSSHGWTHHQHFPLQTHFLTPLHTPQATFTFSLLIPFQSLLDSASVTVTSSPNSPSQLVTAAEEEVRLGVTIGRSRKRPKTVTMMMFLIFPPSGSVMLQKVLNLKVLFDWPISWGRSRMSSSFFFFPPELVARELRVGYLGIARELRVEWVVVLFVWVGPFAPALDPCYAFSLLQILVVWDLFRRQIMELRIRA